MAPEPLVTVTTFGDPELAEGDLRRLQNAGLDAYLGGEYHRYHGPVELKVPQSQVGRAFELLGLDPPAPEDPERASVALEVCPDCGSASFRKLPPYAFRVLLGSVVLLAISIAIGQSWIGFAGMGIACRCDVAEPLFWTLPLPGLRSRLETG